MHCAAAGRREEVAVIRCLASIPDDPLLLHGENRRTLRALVPTNLCNHGLTRTTDRLPSLPSRRKSGHPEDPSRWLALKTSSPPLPLSLSHLTVISRALECQQRKAPGAPSAMAMRHEFFAVSPPRYSILFHLILCLILPPITTYIQYLQVQIYFQSLIYDKFACTIYSVW